MHAWINFNRWNFTKAYDCLCHTRLLWHRRVGVYLLSGLKPWLQWLVIHGSFSYLGVNQGSIVAPTVLFYISEIPKGLKISEVACLRNIPNATKPSSYCLRLCFPSIRFKCPYKWQSVQSTACSCFLTHLVWCCLQLYFTRGWVGLGVF